MTLREAMNKAIDTNDAALAGKICDHLRAQGFTYDSVLAFARRTRPDLTDARWEDLMEAADHAEGAH